MVDGEGEPADITLGGLGVPGGVQIPAVIHVQVAINPPGRYRDRPSTRADLRQRGPLLAADGGGEELVAGMHRERGGVEVVAPDTRSAIAPDGLHVRPKPRP